MKPKMWTLCKVFGVLFFAIEEINLFATGFNVDTKNPVIIKNYLGNPGSLFGYSVVLLPPGNSSSSSGFSTKGWILISAPKANSSYVNHKNINEPGVIWRCSLGREILKTNECTLLVMDPTEAFDPKIPKVAHMDWKNESWMGGSMTLGSERFVACASRWCNQKYNIRGTEVKDHFMNGICYWVPRSHLQSDIVNETWPWLPANHSYRLLPLVDIKRRSDWAYGAAGFSAHLADEGELIIGAPGISSASGAVIEYSDNPRPDEDYERYNHNGNQAFAEVVVSEPVNRNGGTYLFEYFGYAVTSGHFFKTARVGTRRQYVAGAPRADNLRGKVYIFMLKKPNSKNKTASIVSSDAEIDLIHESLEGPGVNNSDLFSYFGSVLCTCDVNNDGFDDLLVGAPFFSLKDYRSLEPGEQGCVFVYTSNGSKFDTIPVRICGSGYRFSNFGSAISALGDIDGDHFSDVAIGAPREKIRGAVYIYRGSASGLKFSQKLTPESIDPIILGFGYSLATGTDIDGNLYPDLAVGCYTSEQVIVYRTIPVVTTTGQIYADVRKLWSNVFNFNIISCINFYGKSLPQKLDFIVNVTLDARKNSAIIQWDLPNVSLTKGITVDNVSPNNLVYRSKFENGTCYSIAAKKVQDKSLHSEISFLQVHGLIRPQNDAANVSAIHYEIYQRDDGSSSVNFDASQTDFSEFLSKVPIAQNNESITTPGTLGLSKDCCSLTEHTCNVEHACTAALALNVSTYGSSSDKTPGSEWVKSWTVQASNRLKFEITITNLGEFAHFPIQVKVFWDASVDIPIKVSDEVSCQKMDHPMHVICEIDSPIRHKSQRTLKVILVIEKLFQGLTDGLTFNVSAIASNSPEVIYPYNQTLYFRGQVKLFNLKSPRIILPKVFSGFFSLSQKFTMKLVGPSPVYAIQLEFYIPHSIRIAGRDEKLLEFSGIYDPRSKGLLNCRPQQKSWFLNNERFTSGDNGRRDDKKVDTWGDERNVFRIKNIFPWKVQNKSLLASSIAIHCGSSVVSCTAIICDPVNYYEPGFITDFEVGLKLDTQHLSFFDDLRTLEIQSEVKGKFLNHRKEILGEEMFNGSLVTTLIILSEDEFPAWAVIVGTCFGMVFLILIIFGLSQCGFFRRRRRESLQRLLSVNQFSDFDPNPAFDKY